VDVKPMPGLEHLPFAEVWLREPDETAWRRLEISLAGFRDSR